MGESFKPTYEDDVSPEEILAHFGSFSAEPAVEKTQPSKVEEVPRLNAGVRVASLAMEGARTALQNTAQNLLLDSGGGFSRRKVAGLLVGGVMVGGFGSDTQLIENPQKVTNVVNTNERPPSDPSERVHFEVVRALRLLKDGDPLSVLQSPFLVSALYYSDAFLKEIQEEDVHNEGQTIIASIARSISPELRMRFADALAQKARDPMSKFSTFAAPPFRGMNIDAGRGENHPDALDLFAPEGTEVSLIQSGIVVLSERSWDTADSFSTSSFKGGNAVIVYDPKHNEFFRYCHLDKVEAEVGVCIEAGTKIGTIGHTGKNAALPGHGGHLHLEINTLQRMTGEMDAVNATNIKARLTLIAELSH